MSIEAMIAHTIEVIGADSTVTCTNDFLGDRNGLILREIVARRAATRTERSGTKDLDEAKRRS